MTEDNGGGITKTATLYFCAGRSTVLQKRNIFTGYPHLKLLHTVLLRGQIIQHGLDSSMIFSRDLLSRNRMFLLSNGPMAELPTSSFFRPDQLSYFDSLCFMACCAINFIQLVQQGVKTVD